MTTCMMHLTSSINAIAASEISLLSCIATLLNHFWCVSFSWDPEMFHPWGRRGQIQALERRRTPTSLSISAAGSYVPAGRPGLREKDLTSIEHGGLLAMSCSRPFSEHNTSLLDHLSVAKHPDCQIQGWTLSAQEFGENF